MAFEIQFSQKVIDDFLEQCKKEGVKVKEINGESFVTLPVGKPKTEEDGRE